MPTIRRPKQVSEMSDEELQAYEEPGVEEGDWLDYLPGAGSVEARGVGMAKRISKGALERIKSAAKAKAAQRGMEKLKTANESPFKQEGEHVLDYSKIGKEGQEQLNSQLREKVPVAKEISYKRDLVTGEQDMLADPMVRGFSKKALPSIQAPVAAAMGDQPPELPTPVPPEQKGTAPQPIVGPKEKPRRRIIRKNKQQDIELADEDDSASPPEYVAGSY